MGAESKPSAVLMQRSTHRDPVFVSGKTRDPIDFSVYAASGMT
jgi:hypothetical protein